MSRTKLCHLLWYQLSDDEQHVEIYSAVRLALFGYPITLSKRAMVLPCHYDEKGADDDWESCFDCPYAHDCNVVQRCTNEQAEQYATEIPNICPFLKGADDE